MPKLTTVEASKIIMALKGCKNYFFTHMYMYKERPFMSSVGKQVGTKNVHCYREIVSNYTCRFWYLMRVWSILCGHTLSSVSSCPVAARTIHMRASTKWGHTLRNRRVSSPDDDILRSAPGGGRREREEKLNKDTKDESTCTVYMYVQHSTRLPFEIFKDA